MLLAAGLLLPVAFLAGCNGTAPTAPKITPAQFVAIACPPVQQALALAPTVTALSATAQADVTAANKVVTAACAAGATVSVATVGQFAQTVLPAASQVVNAAPDSLFSADATAAAQKKAAITGGIALATLAVDTVVAVQANAAAAASSASAASAPAVAVPASAASGA
jgi:hypothetical protein